MVEPSGNEARLSSRIAAPPEAVAAFCRRWRISEMALFGSVLRDDFGPESDIDVMVEFEPDGIPGLRFVSLAAELSGLFGRPVDVLTRSAVERSPNYLRRNRILESAEIVYAAG